ncbi:hypothetical protein PHYBLDRAFT_151721 [Phycomyces blakesleeanus NRRL 1555(-)]|uniref:DDE Tnp4 domain-containing protein n=1 Tax=Phycomyces blakesleeanus (strain ATCC 8743b / DSM 1359 / FGSC 10004 / NBRC 33097 / NRRL 1555) TaxID=763407 RepID=A0A162WHB3_PHYB8|nr:hypothetical protein PHYBLDRAFT_151721 [Phycomyces blakesleeanus NRRL 1555(-)]OAD67115.1 hypothetical protein PHYBLDRAFT_151721 [Phycomyces blakesleeanus NRRL 1555(-)]|eukprot:XP_018285155.1 hypothetical protein PHYBLDRAFT_151721 [Phycomyces blakesleeanus NRRL 1555(-)]
MLHTPINILAKSTLDASAAITQHTLKKMIKMLSDSNVIACEEDHDMYKDFAGICKSKLQQEKLMVMKAQDNISKGRYFFKEQNKTKKLVTQKERLNFMLALDESSFLEELQISIVLDELELNGNSLLSDHFARRSEIGMGSIKNITIRFFKVILSLEHKFVYWPTKSEKLAKVSLWKSEQFFGRRSTYYVNSVAVCNHRRIIQYMSTGFFGSSHDMCTLSECELRKFPERFFSDDEYVLADVGYKAMNNIVPIKKKPRNSELSLADQEKEDIVKVNAWIWVCVALNNFLMCQDDNKWSQEAKHQWEDREKAEVECLQKT